MITGAKLSPDFFLDDEDISEILSSTEAGSEASKDTPEGVFNLTRSLITEEVVKEINASFLFVVDGKHPGKFQVMHPLNMGIWKIVTN